MADIATKSRPHVGTPAIHERGIPVARLEAVVERTSELSEEVLKSLEAGEWAAVEAVGQFLMTIEEALPQEVASTSDVAKKLTESRLEMADRLLHTVHDVLRNVIDSAATALVGPDDARPHAAH
jgi:hypothetical protein